MTAPTIIRTIADMRAIVNRWKAAGETVGLRWFRREGA